MEQTRFGGSDIWRKQITRKRELIMENRQNRQGQPMSYGKRFWHVWGAFIINWGIGILISTAALMLFLGLYGASHTKEMLSSLENQAAMLNIYDRVVEMMQRHTVEILGVRALITIPVMFFLYRRDRKRERVLGPVRERKTPAVMYILTAALAGTLSMALNNLIIISDLSSYSLGYQETSTAFYSASMGMQILCLGILSPVAEELVFRGLMYRRMREDTKMVMAMIYTAVIFGLFHGNTVQMIYGTAMGLILAYVCEICGSVLAPMIGHMAANLLSIGATYFRVYDWMITDIMIIGGITVACATAAACVFLMIRKVENTANIANNIAK